jgi:hypothetical protein
VIVPIQAVQLAKAVFDRNEGMLFRALDGLTHEELHEMVGPDSNPIGWLMWHLSRVQDNHFSAMEGKEHAWIAEGWREKFGRGEMPVSDRGRGHTSQEVTAFASPDVDTLTAYYRAVSAHTDAFLDSLSEADMDRQVPSLADDGTTVPLHERMEMCLMDTLQHSGQIAYLRGLIKGKGWNPA